MLSVASVPAQEDTERTELPSADSPASPEAKSPDIRKGLKPKKAALPWVPDLAEGYRQSLQQQRPALIRVVSESCPWCRKLALEMDKPEVQRELARWTLVHVDVAKAPGDARRLGIGPVPALRIATAAGLPVASHDGFLPAEALVAFLKQHHETASAPPEGTLLDVGKPDPVAIIRLVRQFDERNPALREAAIRRLLPYPASARTSVLKAFREGNLATRLTAWELLTDWGAPVEGLDPWRPKTITDQHKAKLQQWAAEAAEADKAQTEAAQANAAGTEAAETEPADTEPSRSDELAVEQLVAARRQIDRMLKGDAMQARAIRGRLARMGRALLPEVYDRLKQAETDADRARLLALRYRLVANSALVVRWQGGLERLAAADLSTRRTAAEQLAKMATFDDQQLLLELFSDPDPLIREISLRGLEHLGGRQASAALVKLLSDPEPNVRAAVLKQLAEDAPKQLLSRVAEYVKSEKDPDLIVHAIRYFREAKGADAIKALMPLLKHERWQVRAEAAESVGQAIGSLRSGGSNELRADAYIALIELLDDADPFVVSRAVGGLEDVDMAVAVEPLVKAATKHPDLATKIVDVLVNNDEMHAKALPHLRKFSMTGSPPIRAAAIAGLYRVAPDAVEEETAAGLRDENTVVRTATATALFARFEHVRSDAEDDVFESSLSRTPDIIFDDPFV